MVSLAVSCSAHCRCYYFMAVRAINMNRLFPFQLYRSKNKTIYYVACNDQLVFAFSNDQSVEI